MTSGLVISAPRSGSGKTVVTLGLLRAFARAGLSVGSFKNGPDYIDPAFHAAATGRDSLNLDSWAMPPPLIGALVARTTHGVDLLIGEGSMGLFDGVAAQPGATGATADLAVHLDLPVLLVLDVSGQSQSAAAFAAGCVALEPRLRIGGVILNRVASDRHRRLAGDALTAAGFSVVGSLPRGEALALPERHLGLVQAGEFPRLDAMLEAIADFVSAHVDLDAVRACAFPVRSGEILPRAKRGGGGPPKAVEEAAVGLDTGFFARTFPSTRCDSPLHHAAHGPPPPPSAGQDLQSQIALSEGSVPPPGQRVAIARDAAFSFLYPHLVAGWRAQGAELVLFSPLADEPPPDGCDACWLPGGYPELHAGALAAASRFKAGLRRFAERRPIHGECGGYMVLGEGLVDADGASHAMVGLLGVATSFAKRKMHLGYRDVTLMTDGCLGRGGTRLRGHEFHYATVLDAGGDAPFALARDAHGGEPIPMGSRRDTVTGSFFHLIARV